MLSELFSKHSDTKLDLKIVDQNLEGEGRLFRPRLDLHWFTVLRMVYYKEIKVHFVMVALIGL